VRKEIPKPREEAFICIFCGCAGHLNEFCFHRKRIEKMRFDYARNSYRAKFSDCLPHSYSRASPRTFSRALSHCSHGPNHLSYGFGSQKNTFVPRYFGYDPRPHHGDHFPRRPSFPIGGSHTHPEPRHLNSLHFFHRGSCLTGSNGGVKRIVKTSSGHMVKWWISKIYLINPNTDPSIFSRPM
jgi:hypothetical protein